MTKSRLREVKEQFARIWKRIWTPSSFKVKGLEMDAARRHNLRKHEARQAAELFDGWR